MYYTSYFANNAKHPKAVAISLSVPRWFNGNRYSELAPSWDLLSDWRKGTITEAEYTKRYLKILKSREVTAKKIVKDLPVGSVLLCYEHPNKFCHRHIVADLLQKYGVEIKEL